MSRILYFDCFSGASGDMVLGALLDAGLPLEELRAALGSLAVEGVSVSAAKVLRAGVSATKFSVHENGRYGHPHDHAHSHDHDERHLHDHPREQATAHTHDHSAAAVAQAHGHRSLPEINALIERSALSGSAKSRAGQLFQRLGEVEAAIHQIPVETIHLHEVGALDSIIDIVGAVFALEWFKADRIVSSPLNVGGGMVMSAHGRFPVPAPATLKLLEGIPMYSSGAERELVTPTGALLVSSYATAFGPTPAMTVDRIGYGAGDRDPSDTPNVLRVMIGESAGHAGTEQIVVVECEIDDMNPQLFGSVMDRLYAAGALEVYFAAVQMKKNRPGTLLTILARPEQRGSLVSIVFRETTTIGVRYHEVTRERLEREIVRVETPLGPIRFKVARLCGEVVNASPEFEDCLRVAAGEAMPVKEVQAIAVKAYLDRENAGRNPQG
ncbi:MAG TPA: nickel pincer cofactor biosynthesis protein LarC [Vicinamibacterales bacterium]|nr:nickel pincer cofactor biosynthesis protein LarC [Vicinamibacterales bacterium]